MIGELLAIVIGQGLNSFRYRLETPNDGRRDEIGGLVLDFCQYGRTTLAFDQLYDYLLIALAHQCIALTAPDPSIAFHYDPGARKSVCDKGFADVGPDRPHAAYGASSGISGSSKDRSPLLYRRRHCSGSSHGSSRLPMRSARGFFGISKCFQRKKTESAICRASRLLSARFSARRKPDLVDDFVNPKYG
jgi:hypothetical protein